MRRTKKKKKKKNNKKKNINLNLKCKCHYKIPERTVPISVNGVERKNFKEVLFFCWVINPKKVKEAFKRVFKREIFTDDFPLIIKHNKLKMDWILYGVDFKSMLLNIRFNNQDMENINKISFYNK